MDSEFFMSLFAFVGFAACMAVTVVLCMFAAVAVRHALRLLRRLRDREGGEDAIGTRDSEQAS